MLRSREWWGVWLIQHIGIREREGWYHYASMETVIVIHINWHIMKLQKYQWLYHDNNFSSFSIVIKFQHNICLCHLLPPFDSFKLLALCTEKRLIVEIWVKDHDSGQELFKLILFSSQWTATWVQEQLKKRLGSAFFLYAWEGEKTCHSSQSIASTTANADESVTERN